MKKIIRHLTAFALVLVLAAADPAFVMAEPDDVLQEEVQNEENNDSPETTPYEGGVSGETVSSEEAFEEKEEDGLLEDEKFEDEVSGKTSDGLPQFKEDRLDDVIVTGYNYIPGEEEVESIADFGEGEEDSLMDLNLTDPLPSSYTTPNLPPLRNQNPYGTCWAHSAMAVAEISMMKQGLISSADFSELHLAYFSYYTPADPTGRMNGDRNSAIYSGAKPNFLERGGSHGFASNLLANWIGAADESTAPYSEAETALSQGLPDSIAYTDAAHLKNFYKINTTGDEDRDAIKRIVRDLGAAGVSFNIPGNWAQINTYYNKEHNSFYYSDYVSETNHAVTIVGWDDDFPKEHFNKQPQGNGAWLIRNSWHDDGDSPYSVDGYFWMSYYDKGLAKSAAWGYEYDTTETYDHNYQYDGGMDTHYPYSTSSDTIREANIFTVASDAGKEVLKAVSFVTRNTNVNYTVDVYKNLSKADDPASGTKVSTVSGATSYEGYYTAVLTKEVELNPGDKFSVVVTLSKTGDELKYSTEYTTSSYWYSSTVTARPGESFVSKKKTNGNWSEWEDTSGVDKTGNVRIKAFTVNDPSTYPLVTYDANGGTFDGGSTTYEENIKEGRNYVFPTAPSMAGYDVVGWFTEPEGGTQITESDTVSGDIRLYAHWTGKTYSVTFDANGGTFDDGSTLKSGSAKYAENYGTLPTPELTGHIFKGWYTQASGGQPVTSTTKVTQRSAHTLYARWEIGIYKVTFDKNGGECAESERLIKYDDPYGALPEATRNHYSFDGWYSAARGGKKIEADTIMDTPNDHPLYAHWTGESVKFTFDYNDGSGIKKYQNVSYGGCFVSLPYIAKTGYNLLGWFTAPVGGTEIKSSTVVDESTPTTIYAHWDIARFVLNLDANGGKFSDSSTKKTKDIVYGQPYGELETPSQAGQLFEGWFTAKTGGDKITKDTITDTMKNVFAYAHWKEDTNIYVQVTFDENGGTPLPAAERTRTVIYGQPYGTLPVPTPSSAGQVFDGWYSTPSEGGSKVTEYTTVKAKTAHNLYARWKDRICTVTLDANGGEWDDGRTKIRFTKKWDTCVSEEEIKAYGNPIKSSNRFRKAWFKDKNGTEPYDFDEAVKTDTVIYAGWEYVPGGLVVEGIDEGGYTYTGSAITPKITVYDYSITPDRPLTASVDYTVTYKNNINVGDATSKDKPSVIINGKGIYKNSKTLYFTIKPASFGDGQEFAEGFTVTVADKQYNGKKQISKPTIKYGKVTLKENKDYTYTFSGTPVVSGEPVKAGRVIVNVTAAGSNYTGSAKTFYDICAKGTSLSSAVVSKIPDQVYSGEDFDINSLLPYITVKESKSSSKILTPGSPEGDDGDYYVRYASGSNRRNVGTANLEIVGRGSYSGRTKASFKIVGKNVGTCTVNVDDCVYNGSAQKPKVTVTHKIAGTPVELSEGTDYTLTYFNNTKAGQKGTGKTSPKVVIKGKGNYSGSAEEGFTISKMQLSSSNLDIVIPDIKGTGKKVDAKTLRPAVSYYDKNTGKTVKLSSGTDYDIVFDHDTSKQIQTVGFVLKGNYKNAPDVDEGKIERQFLIYNTQISLSEALATGKLEYKAYTDEITYNGAAQKPLVELKCSVDKKKVVLTEGKDFTVSYSNNTAAAEYNSKKAPLWKVAGKGAFAGAVYGTFTIEKRELDPNEFEIVVADVKYTGKQQNPAVKVIEKATGKAVAASEYTVTYGSTTAITENASVTVTAKGTNGVGNYTGVLNGTFRVYANPISGAVIEKLGAQTYTGSQIRPDDVVIYSDKKKTTRLTKGVHYTLEYGANTKVGTGTVIVNGTGSYGGSATVKFSIVPKGMQ